VQYFNQGIRLVAMALHGHVEGFEAEIAARVVAFAGGLTGGVVRSGVSRHGSPVSSGMGWLGRWRRRHSA
jgi:hypothetical protein